MNKKKIMITCDEATSICDKKQYGEATFSERMKLNLHLMLCKHCRAYSMQNNYITKILNKYLDKNHMHDHLGAEEKSILEQKLQTKIKDLETRKD